MVEKILEGIVKKEEIEIFCPICGLSTKHCHDPDKHQYQGDNIRPYSCRECDFTRYYFLNDKWPGYKKHKT